MTRRAAPGLNSRGELAEGAFQAQVIGLLRVYGWTLIYHAPDNRPAGRTGRPQRLAAPEGAGFPDVVAIHGERAELLVAELKAKGGRVRPGQREWLAAFDRIGRAVRDAVMREPGAELGPGALPNRGLDRPGAPRVSAHLWTPADWDELHDVIRGRAPRREDLDPPPATGGLY